MVFTKVLDATAVRGQCSVLDDDHNAEFRPIIVERSGIANVEDKLQTHLGSVPVPAVDITDDDAHVNYNFTYFVRLVNDGRKQFTRYFKDGWKIFRQTRNLAVGDRVEFTWADAPQYLLQVRVLGPVVQPQPPAEEEVVQEEKPSEEEVDIAQTLLQLKTTQRGTKRKRSQPRYEARYGVRTLEAEANPERSLSLPFPEIERKKLLHGVGDMENPIDALVQFFSRYRTLDVKPILLETVSHQILPQMSSPLWEDINDLLKDYLWFMDDYQRESADLTYLAYQHHTYLAGDQAVVKLLLQTGIDVSDTDAEGNSVLHWSLKASKVSSPEHIRILGLLLKHGARVRQKDKLGLTAVHIAAANGNLEALKILLSYDPDCAYVTSEMKETPLFFATKNDFIECAQLLMSPGATTDVHNLRRERPIDLGKSQDMRCALNRTSVIITSRASQHTACIHNDQLISESCEALSKDVCSTSGSVDSSADVDICKYYALPTGCARGSKCFYWHGQSESEQSSGENVLEKIIWADRVGQAQPGDSANGCKARKPQSAGQDMPGWFVTFKKWLPQFLRKMSRNSEGEYYSLSSLKADFKSTYGIKIVHTGGQVNHMISLPNVSRPPPLVVPRKTIAVPLPETPVHGDDPSDCENGGLTRKESDSDAHSDKTSEKNLSANAANEVNGETTNHNDNEKSKTPRLKRVRCCSLD